MQSASVEPKNVSVNMPVLLAAILDGLVPINFQSAGKVKFLCVASQMSLRTTMRPAALFDVVNVRLPVRLIVLYNPARVDISRLTVEA